MTHSTLQPNVWHGSRLTGGLDAAKGTGAVDGQIYLTSDAGRKIYRWDATLVDWVQLYPVVSMIEVEEVDENPTSAVVTKIIFPNGTLSIVDGVATFSGGGQQELTIDDGDTVTVSNPSQLTFPDGSLAVVGDVATVTFPGGGFGSGRRTIVSRDTHQTVTDLDPIEWSAEETDELSGWVIGNPTRFTNNDAAGQRLWVALNLQISCDGTDPGVIRVKVRLNGTTFVRQWGSSIWDGTAILRSISYGFTVDLPVGEYFEIIVGETGGVTNAAGIEADTPTLSWMEVRET